MVRNTTLAAVILIAGAMLFFASFAHFFLGIPMINEMLDVDQSGADLRHTFHVIWVFSSITMMLCGIWAMFIGISIRKNLIRPKVANTLFANFAFVSNAPELS